MGGRVIWGVGRASQVFLPLKVHWLNCTAATEPDAQGDGRTWCWEPESQHGPGGQCSSVHRRVGDEWAF